MIKTSSFILRTAVLACVLPLAAWSQTTLVSNVAGTLGNNNQVDAGFWRSQAFDMGSTSFNLASLSIRGFENTDGGVFGIYSNSAAGFNNGSDTPNSVLSLFNGTIPDGGTGSTTFTLTPANAVTLDANSRYWIVWQATNNSRWFSPDSAAVGSDATIPSLGLRFSGNSGASWSIGGGETMTVGISGTAIPEPSTYAAIFGGLVLGLAFWRRRQQRVATN